MCPSGTVTLCNALIELWKAQLSKQVSEALHLHQAMQLTHVGYWLAAEQGPTDQQDMHSTSYSPFHADQEAAIQVCARSMLPCASAPVHSPIPCACCSTNALDMLQVLFLS